MIINDLLNKPNSILIGSRGLDVSSEKSDWDIVMLFSEIPQHILNKYDVLDVRQYSNALPLHNGYLIKIMIDNITKIDILGYENISDIKIIKKALEDIKKVPKYILEQKELRIRLYEESLIHYGFKDNRSYYYEEDDDLPF